MQARMAGQRLKDAGGYLTATVEAICVLATSATLWGVTQATEHAVRLPMLALQAQPRNYQLADDALTFATFAVADMLERAQAAVDRERSAGAIPFSGHMGDT